MKSLLRSVYSRIPTEVSSSLDDTPNISKSSPEKSTLLALQYTFVLPISLVLYIFLQVLIGYSSPSFIAAYHHTYPSWVRRWQILFTTLHASNIMLILCRLTHSKNRSNRDRLASLLVSLTISSIASSSYLLTLLTNWGGLCKDAFGVVSPAAQWAEWLVTVPLLFYAALSCGVRSEALDGRDIVILTSISICILSGFLLNYGFSEPINYFLVYTSFLSLMVIIYFAQLSSLKLSKAILKTLRFPPVQPCRRYSFDLMKQKIDQYSKSLVRSMKQKALSIVCLYSMPLFPLIYLMSLFGWLSIDMSAVAMMLAGVASKLLIVTIVTSDRLGIVEEKEYEKAQKHLELRLRQVTEEHKKQATTPLVRRMSSLKRRKKSSTDVNR